MTLHRTASVYVCPLRLLPEMVERTGARHVVSAINADIMPATPTAISPARHLRLAMHDIVEAQHDMTLPGKAHVAELLDFALSWDGKDPMLIHCYAGISRSTAAAFITLCALNPSAPEEAIARALRRSSGTASPNHRFVALADEALGREGRMTAALAAMGPHRVAPECIPFALLPVHGSDTQRAAHLVGDKAARHA